MRTEFASKTGLLVARLKRPLDYETALDGFAEKLDRTRGGLFSSGVDYPGRYSRWEFGFIDPPLELVGNGRRLALRALNARGEILLDLFDPILAEFRCVEKSARLRVLEIAPASGPFPEEQRSLQPSLFSPLRRIVAEFAGIGDAFLGLYGAFGYDLLFQFEPIALKHARPADARELHLFLPDRMYIVDRRKETAFRYDYEFSRKDRTTAGAARSCYAPVPKRRYVEPTEKPEITSDLSAEQYGAMVDAARERMRVGDIFEVVLSRRFDAAYPGAPSGLFAKLKKVNPSPFEFYLQLGPDRLVGTSPEMFVRVEGARVESCPISGTARRGRNAMEDAERLKALIDSEKDEVELTMCTDVDRNDKSRICEPGTVKLLGRRQIETYAGLFHTVDHVEGRLRADVTGLDAFISHMWAVTLTGAPKKWAVEIVEAMETAPRGWYGGAVGALLLNGDVNTGITIRTVHLEDAAEKGGAKKRQMARYRVGATLVWDSTGPEENEETYLKANALFRVLAPSAPATAQAVQVPGPGTGRRIVLIDNEDSFVHTLADYFRQTGAAVATYRHGLSAAQIMAHAPDLVVHSPGPGTPQQFGVPALVEALAQAGVAQFGVCLGLQGTVEAFGGKLAVLAEPRHGKRWNVVHAAKGLFADLPSPCAVGAYHSLYADMAAFPHAALDITAKTEAGIVMAVQHKTLPIAAVQFHPESILSMGWAGRGEIGRILIENALAELVAKPRTRAA
jgi:anthranilate synthase